MNRVPRVKNGVLLVSLLLVISLFGCGASDVESPPPPPLVSITVTTTQSTIVPESSVQFRAIGTYADNREQNITSIATWTSSDTSVALVSDAPGSKGRVMATTKVGSAKITATLDNISGTDILTVAIPRSIEVRPLNPYVALETSAQFTATATFADKSKQDVTNYVSWLSSVPSVAEINSTGLATSKTEGVTVITARFLGIPPGIIEDETTLTSAMPDSIVVTPDNSSVIVGTKQQFTATATFTGTVSTQNVTRSVRWSSSDTAVARIDIAGEATAESPGESSIMAVFTASLGVKSGWTDLVVTEAPLIAIDVTPVVPEIPLGKTLQFTATGTYANNFKEDITATVTWTSTRNEVATISNAVGSEGLATSVAEGTTIIEATRGTLSASTALTITPAELESILVTPANAVVLIGRQIQFAATGVKTDKTPIDLTADPNLSWNSSNPNVANINSTGLAQTFILGITTIKATYVRPSGSLVDSTSLEVVSNIP